MDLVLVIAQKLEARGIDPNIRQTNAILRACTAIVDELAKPTVPATPDMGIASWLQSDDTGLSSRAMARAMFTSDWVRSEGPGYGDASVPVDADDFGRCYRFLRAVPEARDGRIVRVRDLSQQWAALVDAWPRLESLYEAKDWSAFGECLRACVRGAGR